MTTNYIHRIWTYTNYINVSNTQQVGSLPTAQDVIQEVLDVKEVKTRRGSQYQLFLVKWLGKPATESTWVAEDELQRIGPEIYAEISKVFASDIGRFSRGGE